ncbi:MAG: tetratricopeptide repeat protein [Planctomycetota bacterium]
MLARNLGSPSWLAHCLNGLLAATIVFGVCIPVTQGQQFRSRNGVGSQPSASPQTNNNQAQRAYHQTSPSQTGPNPVRSAAAVAAVSRDLLEIYDTTKSATTQQRVSAIIGACRKVVSARGRSQIDRDYAKSLLAWALNRRGEMRSDEAAELVSSGSFDDADRLDALAAEDFRAAIDYAPDNWRTRHNYAISLAMKSSYRRAIQQLDRAIELNPAYANSYFNRGELYFEIGEYEQAIENYGKAIEITPDDPQYYNSRGHSRFMIEDHLAALYDYETAAEMATDSATYQTDLADARQYLGKWKAAAEAYQAAVKANSKYARAYQNAAWLMATCPEKSVRNPELAVAAAKKAIELSERSARTLDTLAAATAAAGKQLDAADLQLEALRLVSAPEEKAELEQRLALYQNGSVYRQPTPLNEPKRSDSSIEDSNIRTASGRNERAR